MRQKPPHFLPIPMHTFYDIIRFLIWIAHLQIHPIITRSASRLFHIFLIWYIFPERRPTIIWTHHLELHYLGRSTHIYIGLGPNNEFFIAGIDPTTHFQLSGTTADRTPRDSETVIA